MSHDDIACRALALLALGLSGCAGDDPTPIRQGSGYRLVPRFSGRAAVPRPLVGAPVLGTTVLVGTLDSAPVTDAVRPVPVARAQPDAIHGRVVLEQAVTCRGRLPSQGGLC